MPSFPWFHSTLWCFLFSKFLQKHGRSETLKQPQSINSLKAIVAGGDILIFSDVKKSVGDLKRNRSWKNALFFWKNQIGISLVLPHSNFLFSSTLSWLWDIDGCRSEIYYISHGNIVHSLVLMNSEHGKILFLKYWFSIYFEWQQ